MNLAHSLLIAFDDRRASVIGRRAGASRRSADRPAMGVHGQDTVRPRTARSGILAAEWCPDRAAARHPRYRGLDNTPYGLVAADYSANLELGIDGVYIATVMIDRINGNFMSTLTSSGNAPQLRTGHCRVVEAKGSPVIGAAARK